MYHKIDTVSIKTITEKPKPKPAQAAIFALYDALAACGYVVNLKPVNGRISAPVMLMERAA